MLKRPAAHLARATFIVANVVAETLTCATSVARCSSRACLLRSAAAVLEDDARGRLERVLERAVTLLEDNADPLGLRLARARAAEVLAHPKRETLPRFVVAVRGVC